MADKENKNPRNVTGPYYVDDSCIDCDQCRSLAEFIFTRDDEIGMSYVLRQPVSADELALAAEAMDVCPSQSIGNDG